MTSGNLVQRAFELAPDCHTLVEVKAKLKREGFISVNHHFDSKSLRRQIEALLQKPLFDQ